MKTIEHFVEGRPFSGKSKRTGKVFNPATGEQSSEVKLASTEDVNEASFTSSVEASFTSELCSPVAGLNTLPVLFDFPLNGLPSTKCSIVFMMILNK